MELCDWYGHSQSFKQVDTRQPEQHMPLMGQHVPYNTGAPAAPQYMQMPGAGQAQVHPGMHPVQTRPLQPQALPFAHAPEQYAAAVQQTEQSGVPAAHAVIPSSQGPAAHTAQATQ